VGDTREPLLTARIAGWPTSSEVGDTNQGFPAAADSGFGSPPGAPGLKRWGSQQKVSPMRRQKLLSGLFGPEGAIYISPGQRPGFPVADASRALKGRSKGTDSWPSEC
jgi:hypothetical protein